MPGIDMKEWTTKQFIEYIDMKFWDAKKRRVSRVSEEWGKWSREMNLVLKERIGFSILKEPLTCTRLKYVFAYWINRSQLLELHHKSKIFGKGAKRHLVEQGKKIKYAATDDPLPKRLADFMKLAENDTVTLIQSKETSSG